MWNRAMKAQRDLGRSGGNEKGKHHRKQHAAIGDHEGPERKLPGVEKRRLGEGKTVSPQRLTLAPERRPQSRAEWRRVRRPATRGVGWEGVRSGQRRGAPSRHKWQVAPQDRGKGRLEDEVQMSLWLQVPGSTAPSAVPRHPGWGHGGSRKQPSKRSGAETTAQDQGGPGARSSHLRLDMLPRRWGKAMSQTHVLFLVNGET